jgi:UDP-N-acetyl-D-glucosamine dehydrogenase
MEPIDHLCQAIANHTTRIGFIGLCGADSLQLAQQFATAEFRVLAFHAQEHITLPMDTSIELVHDFDQLAEADVLILDDPVRLNPAGGADTTELTLALQQIRRTLRSGQLIMISGHVPPGTTQTIALPLLTVDGFVPGRDFFLAYSTRCEQADEPTSRVVGGLDASSLMAAVGLIGSVTPTLRSLSSLAAAELCGLLSATARLIHAAVANELKLLCDRMETDVWEVLDAANLPEFQPSPGGCEAALGFLAWGARRFEVSARFAELADEVNAAMPAFVVSKVADALNDAGKPVRGSRVLVLGIASRKDVADFLDSPAFELMNLLLKKGAVLSYNDPHISQLPKMHRWPRLSMTGSILTPALLAAQDCVLIVTDHSAYDYHAIVANSRLVIDTRNATHAVTLCREKIFRA